MVAMASRDQVPARVQTLAVRYRFCRLGFSGPAAQNADRLPCAEAEQPLRVPAQALGERVDG